MRKLLGAFFVSFFAFASPVITRAHVVFELDEAGRDELLYRQNLDLWLEPLAQGGFWLILLGIIGLVLGTIWLFHHAKFFKQRALYAIKQAESYKPLIPWMLRLSLGIMLMGAGIEGSLISPPVDAVPIIAQLEIIMGFLLMIGFLVRPVALFALVLYIYGLTQSYFILGNFEVVGLALILFSEGVKDKPGIDDLLGLDVQYDKIYNCSWLCNYEGLIYRLALGFMLVYSAIIEKFLSPDAFVAIVEPHAWSSLFPASWWLWGFGGIELLLGILIILGLFVRPLAALAFVVLALTFFMFGESVIYHITIFATLSVLFTTGAGSFSLDNYFSLHHPKKL